MLAAMDTYDLVLGGWRKGMDGKCRCGRVTANLGHDNSKRNREP